MGKSPPQPTPPRETAAAQTATNIGTAVAQARLNNVNQETPYGELVFDEIGTSYYQDPLNNQTYEIPKFRATQRLSPQGQRIMDSTVATQAELGDLALSQSRRLQDTLNTPFTLDGLSNLYSPNLRGVGANDLPTLGRAGARPELATSYIDDFGEQRDEVIDAMIERARPELDRRRTRRETDLINRGHNIGTAGYKEAMDEVARGENDFTLGAILTGGQEASRLAQLSRDQAMFGNAATATMSDDEMRRLGFNNSAAQQGFSNVVSSLGFNNQVEAQRAQEARDRRAMEASERVAVRNQPTNEIAALLGLGQVQQPNFVNPGRNDIPVTDYAGIVANYDQANMQRWQAQQAMFGNVFGGVLGLGANMIRASDRRLKKDIEYTGERTPGGVPVAKWRYKGENGPKRTGFIAQDVEKTQPGAVLRDRRGKRAVHYGRVR